MVQHHFPVTLPTPNFPSSKTVWGRGTPVYAPPSPTLPSILAYAQHKEDFSYIWKFFQQAAQISSSPSGKPWAPQDTEPLLCWRDPARQAGTVPSGPDLLPHHVFREQGIHRETLILLTEEYLLTILGGWSRDPLSKTTPRREPAGSSSLQTIGAALWLYVVLGQWPCQALTQAWLRPNTWEEYFTWPASPWLCQCSHQCCSHTSRNSPQEAAPAPQQWLLPLWSGHSLLAKPPPGKKTEPWFLSPGTADLSQPLCWAGGWTLRTSAPSVQVALIKVLPPIVTVLLVLDWKNKKS